MRQLFIERPLYTLDRKLFLEENNRLLWLAALIFIVSLLLRSWEHFLNPGFYVEDAGYFRSNYYAEFALEKIFKNPNGYFTVFNNFIAQLVGYIDVRYQAYAYLIVATLVCTATVVMFSRSGLIKNRFLLLITPLALGLSGMNHIDYYVTLTFQMYVLVITLFLVLLWEPVPKNSKNLLIAAIIPILVWSGAYSVLAVPFAAGFILLFRGKSLIMLWTIVVTLVYALTASGGGTGVVPSHLFSGYYQELWFEIVVTDVFFMGFRDNANIEKVMLLFAVIIPALYLIRKDRIHLRVLLLLLVIIIATPAPLLLSSKYILYKSVYPCHVLSAQFAWVLFVLILLDRLIEKLREKYRSLAGIVAMTVVVLFVVVDNLKFPSKGNQEILYHTREFLQTIKKYETLGLEDQNKNVFISADGKGIFTPFVIVGSRRPDAVTVKKIHIKQYEKPL